MKTTIEVNGYEIVIKEEEGLVTVEALKDGETVEDFTLETSEEGETAEGGEDLKAFGEEEDDFDGADDDDIEGSDDDELDDVSDDDDDDFGQDEDEVDEEEVSGKLESFESFVKNKIK